MMNRNESDAGIDTRLRTMRILWAVFLLTIGQFLLVLYFADPMTEAERAAASGEPAPGGNPSPLLYLFFALGIAAVGASYVLRQKFYARAERERQPALVHTGLIVALALCEVAALLGLTALFALGNPLAYFLFALAAVGDLFHFPRRDQLLAAYGTGGF
jgi:hypothetical protein